MAIHYDIEHSSSHYVSIDDLLCRTRICQSLTANPDGKTTLSLLRIGNAHIFLDVYCIQQRNILNFLWIRPEMITKRGGEA